MMNHSGHAPWITSSLQVTAARHSDRDRVGQQVVLDAADAVLPLDERVRRYGASRDWFNTMRPGCANVGHDVWSRIKTEANRRALIEYLKTL